LARSVGLASFGRSRLVLWATRLWVWWGNDVGMVEFRPDLFDHQHNFSGLDDGGDLLAHLDIHLFHALSSDDAFDQIITHANAYLCCDDAEAHRFNRPSQLIAR
jgi:hypothetical protein